MTKRQKIAFRAIFFFYVAAVLFLCFGKFDSAPSIPWTLFGLPSDKLVHFCMFFPFPILAFLAFDQFTETLPQTLLFAGITLVVGLELAVGTEWGQAHLTSYRSGDPLDFVADALSLTLSTAVIILWDIRKQKKNA